MSNYLLYRVKGESFVALGTSSPGCILKLFPANTWKKKLVKIYINYALKFKLRVGGVIFCNDFNISPGITIKQFFDGRFGGLNHGDHFLAVWNRGRNRRGRVYIWLVNNSLEISGFIKVVNTDRDRQSLKNEARTLGMLDGITKDFCHPKVITYYEGDYLSLLHTSPIPIDLTKSGVCKNVKGGRFIDSIASILTPNNKFPWEDLYSTEWGGRLNKKLSLQTMENIGSKFGGSLIKVGFIHGDLGSDNVFECGGDIWISDWESSSTQGPLLVDRLSVDLSELWKSNMGNIFSKFRLKYLLSEHYRKEDVLAAVLFLVSYEFPPAVQVFNLWEKEGFCNSI